MPPKGSEDDWDTWWKDKGLHELKVRYRKWWDAQTPYRLKRKTDPLKGSGIEARGL